MAPGGVTRIEEPPRGGSVGRFLAKFAGAIAILAIAALAVLWAIGHFVEKKLAGPDPQTIATASLQGLRAQNKLSAFTARYVAVVTSTQHQFGLSTQKTLIMPGTVQYEVDLAKLRAGDLRWNAGTKTLSVTLPPVTVDAPQIDLTQLRTYGSGGLLTHLTDADQALDQANRAAGQRELVQQANAPTPMRLARAATERAVASSFAMPLAAAGIQAHVDVHFAGEPDPGEQWDVTRPIKDVLANR